MNSLKQKHIELLTEILWPRQKYPKRSLNWTEEHGKGEMLILLFTKLSWLCVEFDTRNKVFQENRARVCQDNERARQLK